ncbi:MAG: acyltransferase [Bacteroidaceae bacterium]|nr:acyltransferase [Bacteroidaceae bacterium]
MEQFKLSDFDDIRPYSEGEMKEAFNSMLQDRQFSHILKGMVPWMPAGIRNALLKTLFIGIKTPQDFQIRYMKHAVKYVLRKCSTGHSYHFDKSLKKNGSYTFMSNHRDIVLDSAILDVMLIDEGFAKTVEIAIGDNLLIYPWIKTLVKMNKSFTVNRGLTPKETLKSSIHMSNYMHFAINSKHENIWIAQREGRAKDSNDRTQESVLKMLTLGGPYEGRGTADIIKNIKDMNIVPLSISYEYDPCDYLKAQEFQQKRDIQGWKKSKQDDLNNMKIGIWGKKGHIHYEAAPCINDWLDTLDAENIAKTDIYRIIAEHIDQEIHKSYTIYPGNRIALAELSNDSSILEGVTEKDKKVFDKYINEKIAKIKLENPDVPFLRERILEMYANPLKNHLEAKK